MTRILATMAGIVMLACAGLLILNAREDADTARARTAACTSAAVAEARRQAESLRPLGYRPTPSIDHCTFEQRWDMKQAVLAGFALAGGLGFFILAATRRPGRA